MKEFNFYVGDKYRTNELSLQKGGYDLKMYYTNRGPLVYKRVKHPYAFFKEAKDNNPCVKGYKILKESK